MQKKRFNFWLMWVFFSMSIWLSAQVQRIEEPVSIEDEYEDVMNTEIKKDIEALEENSDYMEKHPTRFPKNFKEKYQQTVKYKENTLAIDSSDVVYGQTDSVKVKEKETKPPPEVKSRKIPVLGNLFYALGILLVIAVTALIIYKSGGFKRNKKINSVENAVEEEQLDEETFKKQSFQDLVVQAKRKGENQKVVRYYYLWILQRMSQKEIIAWHPDKTNWDYYMEIKDGELQNAFAEASYFFNYVIYGGFIVEEKDLDKMEQVMQSIMKKIK